MSINTPVVWAFKEWAAICRAVAEGRQTALFRNGGIHEEGGEFTADRDGFWLFPTRFHQADDQLSKEGQIFGQLAREDHVDDGTVRLAVYCEVIDVARIERESVLPKLRPYHVYEGRVLADRFQYRRPGITLMIVRAAIANPQLILPDSPHFDGCRSWVDLPPGLQSPPLRHVLNDDVFERTRIEILKAAAAPKIV